MNYLRREYFIISYFARLLRRNFRKYVTVAGFTYSLGALGLYPSSKPTYFFCRYIDDLADGDYVLPHGQSFESFIEELIEFLKAPEQPTKITIQLVLADAVRKLEKCTDRATIQAELTHFLKSMLLDYQRRTTQTTLDQKGIHELYHRSFSSVLKLALLGFGIQLENERVQQLGLVQGKIYALQDIEDDLSQAIINVPAELIKATGLSVEEVVNTPHRLTAMDAFLQWRHQELVEAKSLVDALLGLKTSEKGMKMIRVLVNPLDDYIQQELITATSKESLKLSMNLRS